jgi:predicted phage terminase large subunit-like protein
MPGFTGGQDKKLMVFIPPQHGKSEIVSRRFPAWALGKNPDLKIAGCSYSSDLAGQFSRSIQRAIDAPEYAGLFPETRLNGSNLRTVVRGYLRNVDIFETVGHRGFYKAVGVCTGLTGTPVDIAIIDDPVKDSIEAYSATYRERVWDWYINVLLTRLHNDSRQLFIMTRWHDDDLAGRIIKHDGNEWDIVCIPAIKENNDNPDDPREIGAALWETRHSIEKLRSMEKLSLRTFTALYQQKPSIDGGNIIKKEWFGHISAAQFKAIRGDTPMHFFLDTAYDEKKSKTDNDPSGILSACKIGNQLFICHAQKVWKAFPDLIRFLPEYCKAWGYDRRSTLRIEPKANGISVVQQLRESTDLNVTKTPAPTDSKETRLNVASPKVECGRVVLVEGEWNENFMEEVCKFPAMAHDEYVDLLSYAIDYYLSDKKPVNISRLSNLSR